MFTSGYRPRYREWIELPDAFDDLGFPIQRDGASTVVPGLYFMGTHFLRKRKSSTLFGMGEDAAIVTRQIVEQVGRGARGLTRTAPRPPIGQMQPTWKST